jgi:hypothetical protein
VWKKRKWRMRELRMRVDNVGERGCEGREPMII